MADPIEISQSNSLGQSGVLRSSHTHVGTRIHESPLLWLPYSLGCLLDISKHHNLSKCLSKLTIGLDRLYSSDALPSFTFRDWNLERPEPPIRRGINPYNLEELTVEQNWLIFSGQAQILLGDALKNLPNVVELSLRDTNVARQSNRPGSSRLVVSYGAARICRDTGVNFLDGGSHLHAQDPFADLVLAAVWLATGRSGTRLNAITADIQKENMGLSSSAFAMPKYFLESLKPTLNNLQTLDLSVSFTQVALGGIMNGSTGFLRWQRHHLFSLLDHTPNLVCLRVKNKGHGFLADGIIGWLASLIDLSNGKQAEGSRLHGPLRASLDRIPLSQRLQSLRELELRNMIAPTASVAKVLLYLSTSLRQLYLYAVGVWIDKNDEELDNNPRCPNAWTILFEEMSKSLNLEDFKFEGLGHYTTTCSTYPGLRHQVAFLKSVVGAQSGPHNGMLNTWSHTGSIQAVRSLLLEIAEKTIIICTQCKQRNHGYRAFEDIVQQ
ncbi:hypothetical protein AAE478_005280 [Parahypoxylon ruwenzoriense]